MPQMPGMMPGMMPVNMGQMGMPMMPNMQMPMGAPQEKKREQ